ncbi:PLP-dependent aminotransferase family protein [Leptospira sp. 96542]|nr:PLP-dependent aminotransferase family protein [Leptospira sp. 96542]
MKTKYQYLADELKSEIINGHYKPGEKIPSLREIQILKNCSLSTAKEAYRILEDNRLIHVKPQSGFLVRLDLKSEIEGPQTEFFDTVDADDRIQQIMRNVLDPKLLPLGAAIPDQRFLPLQKLNRAYKKAVQYQNTYAYGDMQGFPPLREWIAAKTSSSGYKVGNSQVLITNGCTEALSLSIQSCVNAGDVVIVPSPTYVGVFQILESLKLKVIEIPYRSEIGISTNEFEVLCKKHNPKLLLVSANFNNPNGVLFSDDLKQRIVNICEYYNISIIEDEIYGELYFQDKRPKPLVSFAYNTKNSSKTFLCSSFSKVLSPGLRIGWLTSKNAHLPATKLARAFKISQNQISQIVCHEYLNQSLYEKQMRFMRNQFLSQVKVYTESLTQKSEGNLDIQPPDGGFVLWIKSRTHSNKVMMEAKKLGMAIAPGSLFGLSNHWDHYFRINTSVYYTNKVDEILTKFGRSFIKNK